MVDREISLGCVIAWFLSVVTTALLVVAIGLGINGQDTHALLLGCVATVVSMATAVAHIRCYFLAQNKMLRALVRPQPQMPQQDLRPVR